MSDTDRTRCERIARPAASWLCLVGAMALIGLVVLMPPWLRVQRLQLQLQVVQSGSAALAEQRKAAAAIEADLERADPVLLEHLAYHHLGLRPAGTQPLAPLPTASIHVQMAGAAGAVASVPRSVALESVERRLDAPRPHLDLGPPRPASSLVRLCRGWRRLGVIALAAVCIALGLVTASNRHAA